MPQRAPHVLLEPSRRVTAVPRRDAEEGRRSDAQTEASELKTEQGDHRTEGDRLTVGEVGQPCRAEDQRQPDRAHGDDQRQLDAVHQGLRRRLHLPLTHDCPRRGKRLRRLLVAGDLDRLSTFLPSSGSRPSPSVSTSSWTTYLPGSASGTTRYTPSASVTACRPRCPLVFDEHRNVTPSVTLSPSSSWKRFCSVPLIDSVASSSCA